MTIQPLSSRPLLPARAPQAKAPTAADSFQPLRGTWWQPPMRPVASPARSTPQAPPTVGEQRQFFVWDLSVMPPGTKEITATCRASGDNAYFFVDNAAPVTDADVATLAERFERKSPSGSVDPRQGVAALDHSWFGPPPLGLDGDPKAYVLITPLASYMGTTMDGYFNPFDTLTDAEAQAQGQRSNEKEVIYLNCASQPIAGDYMQGVLAHEYQHLLNHPHDPAEEAWLSETLAEVAMKVTGYNTDMGHVVRHQGKPEKPLVSPTYVDYGACMLFGTYLTERYGKPFIQELARSPLTGVASIDHTLEHFGIPERFDSLYKDWAVANLADSQAVVAPGLHYSSLDLPAPAELTLKREETLQTTLAPTGVRYLRLEGDQAARLAVTADQPGLTLELLTFAGPRMVRTPLDPSQECPLPVGENRVLVLGSLAPAKANVSLSLSP